VQLHLMRLGALDSFATLAIGRCTALLCSDIDVIVASVSMLNFHVFGFARTGFFDRVCLALHSM